VTTAVTSTRTRRAVQALGKFYDVGQNHIFNVTAAIALTTKPLPEAADVEISNWDEIMQAQQDNFDTAAFFAMKDFIAAFYGNSSTMACTGALKDVQDLKVAFPGYQGVGDGQGKVATEATIQVTAWDEALSTLIDPKGTAGQVGVINKQFGFEDTFTGFFKPTNGSYYTMKDDGLHAGKIKKLEESGVSVTPVNTICNFVTSASPSGLNTDIVTLLANSVPPLEWSRCTPFLEIVLASESGRRKIVHQYLNSGKTERNPNESLSQVGQPKEADAPGTQTRIDNIGYTLEANTSGQPSNYGVLGGMEIFTMPQTYINREDLALRGGDPFRPLASIEGFTNSMAGFVNTAADPQRQPVVKDQKASLKLRVHHPRYLKELAPLVKPSEYAGTKILVTYGWAHPDGMIVGRPADAQASPRWGDLLDACKVTEAFAVGTSRISFTDSNEVQLDVELHAAVSSDALLTKKVNSAGEVVTGVEIKGALDGTVDIFGLNRDLAYGETGDYNFTVSVFSDLLKKDSVLNAECANDLQKYTEAVTQYLKDNRGNRGNSSSDGKNLNGVGMSHLQNLFTEIFGKENASSFLKAASSSNPDNTTKFLLKQMNKTPDPWLPHITSKDNSQMQINIDSKAKSNPSTPSYVSFGKIVSFFVGTALSEFKGYSEIQLVYHPLNRSAGSAQCLTVANFPINKSEFDKWFKEYVKGKGYISTRGFIDAVVGRFIHCGGQSKAYGIYDIDKDTDRNKKLLAAYGDEATRTYSPEFVNPRIEVTSQVAPPRLTIKEGKTLKDPEDADPGPHSEQQAGKPIMRITFRDLECNQGWFLNEMFKALSTGGAFPKSPRIRPDNDIGNTVRSGVQHGHEYDYFVKLFTDLGAILPAPSKGTPEYNDLVKDIKDSLPATPAEGSKELDVDATLPKILEDYHRLDTSKKIRESLKGFAGTVLPGKILYGAAGSSIKAITVQTTQDKRYINLALADTRSAAQRKIDNKAGVNPLTMSVMPLEIDITFLGNPFLFPGQEFLVDLNTATNIDQMYRVMSVEHSVQAGAYDTKIKLTPSNSGPRYASAGGEVARFLAGKIYALASNS